MITAIASLKPEMTQAETTKFFKDHGLEIDWTANGSQPTNETEVWL